MTIVDFLTARLDEKQAVAQAALEAAISRAAPARTPGAWHAPGDDPDMPSSFELVFEPEAILLDIAAHRAILAEHKHAPATEPSTDDFGCRICAYDRGDSVLYGWGWCNTVRMLALPYADHPDYDPAWRVA